VAQLLPVGGANEIDVARRVREALDGDIEQRRGQRRRVDAAQLGQPLAQRGDQELAGAGRLGGHRGAGS
jgi:hypothetical protein